MPAAWGGIVTIRPIQVCDDSGANCANAARELFEPEGQKIWDQADIDLLFLDWLTLDSTAFQSIGDTTEHDDLWDNHSDPDNLVVSLFFVLTASDCAGPIGGTLYGCAADTGQITITDAVFSFNGGNGRRDTIAHELGHVLGLPHSAFGSDYLMQSGGSRTIPDGVADITPDGAGLSKLHPSEIDIAQDSAFNQPIPEPSTMVLSVLGLGLVLWRRK
jgi:hypothetical protein